MYIHTIKTIHPRTTNKHPLLNTPMYVCILNYEKLLQVPGTVPRSGELRQGRVGKEEKVLVADAVRVSQPTEPRAERLELVLRDGDLRSRRVVSYRIV